MISDIDFLHATFLLVVERFIDVASNFCFEGTNHLGIVDLARKSHLECLPLLDGLQAQTSLPLLCELLEFVLLVEGRRC